MKTGELSRKVYAQYEAHRMACEARHVMRLDANSRSAYLRSVQIKRGEEALKSLKSEIKRQCQPDFKTEQPELFPGA